MYRKFSRGFTVLEILIAIAILGLLLATILPSFMSFRRSSTLNANTMNLMTLINRARILAVSSKNDDQYGIHLESNKAVLYEGLTYTAGATTNETYTFDSGVTLSSISINGGGSEVLFAKVTGATTQNATTTLLLSGTTSSSTIVIYPTGIASTN